MQANSSEDWPSQQALRPLAQRLGITEGRIQELRRASETIEEICGDLEKCCVKVLRLEQTGQAATPQARDYREMRDQLEQELERHLTEVTRTAARAKETGTSANAGP